MKRQIVVVVMSSLWSVALSDTCTTPLGATGNCILLNDCPPLLALFKQLPLSTKAVSFLKQSHCGSLDFIPKVCCGSLLSKSSTTSLVQRVQTEKSISTVERIFEEDSKPAPNLTCGVDTNGDRIFGGKATEIDEFRWMALLGYKNSINVFNYKCGGALINRRYVLTAAHCITGAIVKEYGSLATVRLGEYDTRNSVDCLGKVCADPPQEILVHAAYPHPGYKDNDKNNKDDIGLVRLARRAIYSHYVQPICLGDKNQSLSVGMDVSVAGWGKTLSGLPSPVKIKVNLPIFNQDMCVRKYKQRTVITGNQICAGGHFGEDSCLNDSGGPLMKRRPEGIWEAVGVISFSVGCGMPGWPGVYTSVASYLDWIQFTLKSSNV